MVHSLASTDAKDGLKSRMRKLSQHLCRTEIETIEECPNQNDKKEFKWKHESKRILILAKNINDLFQKKDIAQSNTMFKDFFIVIIF